MWEVAWAHPRFGSVLASCSFDRKVVVWQESKPNEWKKVKEVEHMGSVNSLAWAPWECGLVLASAGSDKTVNVLRLDRDDQWQVSTIENAHEEAVNSVCWAPLRGFGAFANQQAPGEFQAPQFLATAGCDGRVKVWQYGAEESDGLQMHKFKCVQEIKVSSDWVRDVSWCPNIGSPRDVLVACTEDKQVVFLGNKGRKAGEWSSVEPLGKGPDATEGPVWRASWNVSGTLVAVSLVSMNSDNCVRVYKVVYFC